MTTIDAPCTLMPTKLWRGGTEVALARGRCRRTLVHCRTGGVRSDFGAMHVGAFVLRIALAVVVAGVAACSDPPTPEQQKEQLGSAIFSDTNLSEPAGQSCADCHTERRAFSDP